MASTAVAANADGCLGGRPRVVGVAQQLRDKARLESLCFGAGTLGRARLTLKHRRMHTAMQMGEVDFGFGVGLAT